MRTIKFRYWDKNNNMWLDYIKLSASGQMMTAGDHKMIPIKNKEEVELMQFTGLKDKNGKEIYEGDIVMVHTRANEHEGQSKPYDEIGVVKWSTYRLEIENKKHGMFIGWKRNIKVIGNIYENPELLKGGKL